MAQLDQKWNQPQNTAAGADDSEQVTSLRCSIRKLLWNSHWRSMKSSDTSAAFIGVIPALWSVRPSAADVYKAIETQAISTATPDIRQQAWYGDSAQICQDAEQAVSTIFSTMITDRQAELLLTILADACVAVSNIGIEVDS